jgi:hypothetical protein
MFHASKLLIFFSPPLSTFFSFLLSPSLLFFSTIFFPLFWVKLVCEESEMVVENYEKKDKPAAIDENGLVVPSAINDDYFLLGSRTPPRPTSSDEHVDKKRKI